MRKYLSKQRENCNFLNYLSGKKKHHDEYDTDRYAYDTDRYYADDTYDDDGGDDDDNDEEEYQYY